LRPAFVRLHRWVGLTLTLLLVVIGLTGAIIAWFKPLDEAVNPDLHFVQPSGERLSTLELRERLEAGDPRTHFYYIHFPDKANESFSAYTEGKIDPTTGAPFDIAYDEVFANPYTGERLGERLWGNFSFDREDLISQIYFLHYSLVLPEQLGEGFMGWVAFIWAIDCFVGLYLTLPLLRRRDTGDAAGDGFLGRWSKSWKIKARAGPHRRVFDIHRAVSLWVWAMLLVFAVSGFALNIPDAYASGIKAIAQYEDIEETPDLPEPLTQPAIDWAEALALGRKYMAEAAAREGFLIERPTALIYRREKGIYFYRVQSDRDVVDYGMTSVGIDGTTGLLTGIEIPTGHRAGNTLTSWAMALHMAMVGGIAWKIFVSLMGLVVVTLSLTGVCIWANKRRASRAAGLTAPLDLRANR
jgi:uncharacterized iron-regulated membrane protein